MYQQRHRELHKSDEGTRLPIPPSILCATRTSPRLGPGILHRVIMNYLGPVVTAPLTSSDGQSQVAVLRPSVQNNAPTDFGRVSSSLALVNCALIFTRARKLSSTHPFILDLNNPQNELTACVYTIPGSWRVAFYPQRISQGACGWGAVPLPTL